MNSYQVALVMVAMATLAGCPGAVLDPYGKQKQDEEAAAPAQAAAPPEAEAEPPAEPQPQNALQREARLVDRRVYLQEHPDAIELEKNVIKAGDPFTATSQGYFAAVSQLTIAAYEHDLQIWKASNDNRWPTFAEYEQILKRNGIKLRGLKVGQVYAYDDQTGQISILELPDAAG